MKQLLKTYIPKPVFLIIKRLFLIFMKIYYRIYKRPVTQLETAKAKSRREREGFFDKFCRGNGLDIGYGGDLLAKNCRGWDFEHGDAQYLKGISDEEFDFVYSGHTLEHLVDVEEGLRNWSRVVKPGGYIIIYIPHRDLFERKKTLPSRWNYDHKHFFLLDRDETPDTIGIVPLIERTFPDHMIIYAKVCDEGYAITDPNVHSDGEYSIEVVVKKGL